MARIYSWDELVKQQYATRANLNRARKKAVQILKGLHDRGWIASGTIFGSVARGDHTIGSDVDALIIAHPRYAKQTARYLSRVYQQSMKTLHVQPEIILLTTEEARKGKHDISPFLFRHIIRNSRADTSVGESLNKIMHLLPHNARADEQRELIHLANRSVKEQIALAHQRANDATAYYHAVERGLDRVINRARHAVDILGTKNTRDHKKTMVEEYTRLVGKKHPASQILQNISAARKNYLTILERTIRELKRKPNSKGLRELEKGYRDALTALERTIQESPAFFRMNEALLSVPKITRHEQAPRRITPKKPLRMRGKKR